MIYQARRSAASVFATAAVVAAALLTAVSAAAATHPAGAARAALASWGTAQEVPGTATLNQGNGAVLYSVSCASAGNCSGGGQYVDGSGHEQAFVVSEVSGTWQNAEEAPGTAALNQGGNASIQSVSCASAGNCTAAGDYADGSGHGQVFVVSEVSGTWQNAEEVPGAATLNQGGLAFIQSVSCATAASCSAGGYYKDSSGHLQALVVSKSSGIWHNAREVPGTATLNKGAGAELYSVSCASAGNCSGGGYYFDSSGHKHVFVVGETSFAWKNAQEVPGTAALDQGGFAFLSSVSCGSAGNCSAVGDYTDGSGHGQAFVADETSGTWQNAQEIPGTAALNQGNAAIESVSCASAGNCSAGGNYNNGSEAFVVNETNGTWQNALEVPGTAALNTGGQAGVASVSCASAGNCSAGGLYMAGPVDQEVFVVSETSGTWHNAQEVPGIATLNQGGDAVIQSVSCATAGNCSAGGSYADPSGNEQAFVVSKA